MREIGLGDRSKQRQSLRFEKADDFDLHTIEFETLLPALRSGSPIFYEHQQIALGRKMGGGGNKDVFDVQIEDTHLALALPNTVDGSSQVVIDKWSSVLQEPENTRRVRDAGFLTNELCEIIGVEIEGQRFPALVMRRYEDLPVEVRDKKNRWSSTGTTRLIPKGFETSQISTLIKPLARDITRLLSRGIRLDKDSFNIGVIEGRPRLYLNDLGNARFETITGADMHRIQTAYIRESVRAFIESLSEEEYQEYKKYFETSYKEIESSLQIACEELVVGSK